MSAQVESARGCFDDLRVEEGELFVEGWLLDPEARFDELRLCLDGRDIGPAARVERPDVAAAFPHVSDAAGSGFRAVAPWPAREIEHWSRVEILGRRGARDCGAMECLWRPDFAELCPDPPSHLMLRVVHAAAPRAFRLDGLRTLAEFLDALERQRGGEPIASVLDWGCGAGRMLAFLPHVRPSWRVHGCDVDREAVDWCARHVRGVELRAITPDPPTSYGDARFDAIFAYSIFTHLARERQRPWLAELRRLLAPRGLLVASVHGAHAAELAGDGRVREELARDGISDGRVDRALDGVLPAGSYRAVFQSAAWTRREWGAELELLELCERGAGGFQDLVVLRRP